MTQKEDSSARPSPRTTIRLDVQAGGKRFDGIGVVNGGGATAVLLKDYPEPQHGQILDLVYKPKFGASVSALLVEIPGDGNATQGSMPSHMHTRDDLNYHRGYTWWLLREAKRRNPKLTLDGTAWSAPGWIGSGPGEAGRVPGTQGDAAFWSQDSADYYVSWLRGLRDVHGLELDAIGCRNEKGYSLAFAKLLRRTLNAGGFERVKLHAFDHWPDDKFDFVRDLLNDPEAQQAIDIIGAHVLYRQNGKGQPASAEVQAMAERMGKPIWNTEEHVYLKGFVCAITIVQAFNDNYVRSRATKVVNWYDIAGVYPTQPYAEDPAMIVAHSPWSGHYRVRDALWGYAHYGQFTEVGWQYLDSGCGHFAGGGSYVTLKSPAGDYSIILETKGADGPQPIEFHVGPGLSDQPLCVWRSNQQELFVQQPSIAPAEGRFKLTLEPNAIYSLSTTTGQRNGSFDDVPADHAFPFPYVEDFGQYPAPQACGYLPRYLADIAGAFELVPRPDGPGHCLRQVVPVPTISWAPDWHPYTIFGDAQWHDYEVSAEIRLHPGDTAGILGRINHVGTGYGFIPKGYCLQLSADGTCRLIVVRGKPNKKELIGDAEQQAMIRAANDDSEGGEKTLAATRLANVAADRWYKLTLRFEGTKITGLLDGESVLRTSDPLYARGMAGLLAGRQGDRLSTPYFDNLRVTPLNDGGAQAPVAMPSPLYDTDAPAEGSR